MGDEASFSFDWNEYLHLKRDWRNDIINTSLREYPEHLEMEGENCACVMFIRKYPNGLTDQFLNELTNMNFPLIYTMDVEPLDNDVAYQMVMKKYMSNERSINREQELKNENGDYSTNINYERRKQQRDTEEMLDRISLVLCQEKVQVKHELFTSIICLMPHLFPFVLVLSNISFRSH